MHEQGASSLSDSFSFFELLLQIGQGSCSFLKRAHELRKLIGENALSRSNTGLIKVG